ncbi:hypothetical protein Ocin01_01831 [Orchesella cincta]|uniref:Uncharacterized protein n=1 Tax=Orchesella cincta TaxID=48709 RepID=A0A1D2NHT9_ORCCI|nr:hypothetical protein Ocin01_01831 [Orchesella cincta]
MNKEYAKFDQPRNEYNPPATEPGHFRNLPDLLVPEEYEDVPGDPLERDMHDLYQNTATPPPTPPELEPGRAGCHVFQEEMHYMAPCYQDEDFQRILAVRLIIGNMLTYVPSIILSIWMVSWRELDVFILRNVGKLYITAGSSIVLIGLYSYFVGLCRNPPYLQLALVSRTFLTTAILGSASLCLHSLFIRIIIHEQDTVNAIAQDTGDGINGTLTGKELDRRILAKSNHSPPYIALLMVIVMFFTKTAICYSIMRYKYAIGDYRLPFVIYTLCMSLSCFLVTIVLSNGFGTKPLGYDLFQIITACYLASLLMMRTPRFIQKLFEGKMCPLREDEHMYALNHYGV